jgi:VWFA-related protein
VKAARFFLLSCCLGFGLLSTLNGQEDKATPGSRSNKSGKGDEEFKIRVSVDEVILDAVILDGKGRQITDLAADDFKIYQDGQRQEVTSCVYIKHKTVQTGQPARLKDAKVMPPIATPLLKREDVQRTLVFIVDNRDIGPEDSNHAIMALQKFVETQMDAGDLVAIVPTAGGSSALQMFSSDKRYLLSVIEGLKRTPRRTGGMPQLLAISYCTRALKNMPGRKHLFLLSSETAMPPRTIPWSGIAVQALSRARQAGLSDDAAAHYAMYLEDLNPARFPYNDQMNRLADEALRAGVVVHTMNLKGLAGGELAFDAYSAIMSAAKAGMIERIPLSKKTGGAFIELNNFFLKGIGAANEMLQGYYLLTYTPPPNTFKSEKIFHTLKVSVKRPGSRVHARDGFFGTAKKPDQPSSSGNSLMQAMFSPFRYSDLAVSLNCGYIEDPQEGYLLQTWVHLDGRTLSVIDEADGSHSISLDILGATDNNNGEMQDAGKSQRKVRVTDEELSWIRANGIGFPLVIPAKNPGSYFVRVAVKDNGSGKLGSAYKFIEIPDLKRGFLSLSSIFFGAADNTNGSVRSIYHPGDNFEYKAVIYNANFTHAKKPNLESQVILYKDGTEISRSGFEAVNLDGVSDFKKIPIKKRLELSNSMQPGNYELQLLVKDRQPKLYFNLAAQTLEFEISDK